MFVFNLKIVVSTYFGIEVYNTVPDRKKLYILTVTYYFVFKSLSSLFEGSLIKLKELVKLLLLEPHLIFS